CRPDSRHFPQCSFFGPLTNPCRMELTVAGCDNIPDDRFPGTQKTESTDSTKRKKASMNRFLKPWLMILLACLLVIFGVLNYFIQPKSQFSLGGLMGQLLCAGLLLYWANKLRRK